MYPSCLRVSTGLSWAGRVAQAGPPAVGREGWAGNKQKMELPGSVCEGVACLGVHVLGRGSTTGRELGWQGG